MIRVLFFMLLIGNLLFAAWLLLARPEAHEEPPPVDAGVERLVLLSERQTALPRPGAKQRQAQGEALNCYSLGPFETEADARAAANRIAEHAVRFGIRSTQTEAEIGNWVYLPALPDRETALQMARRLEASGLDDYYIIGAGDEENTISLGLYREPDNAQRRVQRLQSLGFDAQVRARTETVPRYWIDYAVQAGAFAALETLLDEAAGLQREEIECS